MSLVTKLHTQTAQTPPPPKCQEPCCHQTCSILHPRPISTSTRRSQPSSQIYRIRQTSRIGGVTRLSVPIIEDLAELLDPFAGFVRPFVDFIDHTFKDSTTRIVCFPRKISRNEWHCLLESQNCWISWVSFVTLIGISLSLSLPQTARFPSPIFGPPFPCSANHCFLAPRPIPHPHFLASSRQDFLASSPTVFSYGGHFLPQNCRHRNSFLVKSVFLFS